MPSASSTTTPTISPTTTSTANTQPPSCHPRPTDPLTALLDAIKSNAMTRRINSEGSFLLKKFHDFARWTCRSYSPFIIYELVFNVGLRAYGTDDENISAKTLALELEVEESEAKFSLEVFELLKEYLTDRYDDVCKALIANPIEQKALTKQMDVLRGNACSGDAHRMKKESIAFLNQIIPGGLQPPIHPNDDKHARGLNHLQLAELIIPAKYNQRYKTEPDAIIAEISGGILSATDTMIPHFLYDPSIKYDPKNVRKGLFRGHSWIYTYKILFTGPKSATTLEYNSTNRTRQCQGYAHSLRQVTPETIAYACLHAYFAFSSAPEWRTDMSPFSKERYFNSICDMLKASHNTKWGKNLFSWANNLIFGNPAGAPDNAPPPSNDGPTDVDLFYAQDADDDNGSHDDNENNDYDGGDEFGGNSSRNNDAVEDGDDAHIDKRRRIG